jgi:hypothetical protein
MSGFLNFFFKRKRGSLTVAFVVSGRTAGSRMEMEMEVGDVFCLFVRT